MGAPEFDIELTDLAPELRWQEWMRRVEAVLFASATPVSGEALAKVIGRDVHLELLIEDLNIALAERAFEIVAQGDGWMIRTRAAYGPVIRVAADAGVQALDLSQFDTAVLAAIAYNQPVTRKALAEIFGREISRDLIGRLHAQDLIATGPRSPRPGAPYTYVTTSRFLAAFDLRSLRDLPDPEQLEDAGLNQR